MNILDTIVCLMMFAVRVVGMAAVGSGLRHGCNSDLNSSLATYTPMGYQSRHETGNEENLSVAPQAH